MSVIDLEIKFKMTDTDKFLYFFREKNGVLRLGEILGTHFSAEYRKHISLLRKSGHIIEVILNRKSPSQNIYYLDRPKEKNYEFDDVGQGIF